MRYSADTEYRMINRYIPNGYTMALLQNKTTMPSSVPDHCPKTISHCICITVASKTVRECTLNRVRCNSMQTQWMQQCVNTTVYILLHPLQHTVASIVFTYCCIHCVYILLHLLHLHTVASNSIQHTFLICLKVHLFRSENKRCFQKHCTPNDS